MFFQLALYMVIGIGLLSLKKKESKVNVLSLLMFVLFWPFFVLLKYVEMIDNVKRENGEKYRD